MKDLILRILIFICVACSPAYLAESDCTPKYGGPGKWKDLDRCRFLNNQLKNQKISRSDLIFFDETTQIVCCPLKKPNDGTKLSSTTKRNIAEHQRTINYQTEHEDRNILEQNVANNLKREKTKNMNQHEILSESDPGRIVFPTIESENSSKNYFSNEKQEAYDTAKANKYKLLGKNKTNEQIMKPKVTGKKFETSTSRPGNRCSTRTSTCKINPEHQTTAEFMTNQAVTQNPVTVDNATRTNVAQGGYQIISNNQSVIIGTSKENATRNKTKEENKSLENEQQEKRNQTSTELLNATELKAPEEHPKNVDPLVEPSVINEHQATGNEEANGSYIPIKPLGITESITAAESITTSKPITVTEFKTSMKPPNETTESTTTSKSFAVTESTTSTESTTEIVKNTTTTERPMKKSERKCAEYGEVSIQIVRVMGLIGHKPREIKVDKCRHKAIPLVIGGREAMPYEFPHQALLGYDNDVERIIEWKCGGSLVSRNYILTAAHCIEDNNFGTVRFAKLGMFNQFEDTEKTIVRNIIDTIEHPDYDRLNRIDDIGLLKLDEFVQLSEYVNPICLPTKQTENRYAVAAGFGTTERNLNSRRLMKVVLEKFEPYYPDRIKNVTRVEKFLFYGHRTQRRDTCNGDSGGPLQISNDDKVKCSYTLVGITSYGPNECGIPGIPAVYTNVFYYIDWIEQIIWKDDL